RFATQDPVWLPYAHGRVLVGFVGSMKAWHGVMDLLEAFAAVADSPEGPLLVLAGSGPEEEKVRRRATRPDLADRVLVTGAVAHADVPALVRRLELAVAPSANSRASAFTSLKALEY